MSLIRRRFSKRAFLAAYPERIANALFQDAVGILKDAKLRQPFPRGLYESGSEYAKRFWKAARRHPADLNDSWASD